MSACTSCRSPSSSTGRGSPANTGPDGPSHYGIFDLTFLRAMPGLTLAAPSDPQELRDLLHTAVARDPAGPFAIRFPKGAAGETEAQPAHVLPVGEWEVLRQGSAALLLATGKLVSVAMEAAATLDKESLPLTVVNSRYIKPLDPRLKSWARRHPAVLTLEDNVATGGFGSAVAEVLAPLGIPVTVMAVPDTFIEQGGQSELLQQLRLDDQRVAARVRRTVGELESTPKQAVQPGS